MVFSDRKWNLSTLDAVKSSRTKMKPAQFYFINKDARSNSLSHSDKSERVKIHSHVQLSKKAKRSQSPEEQSDKASVRKSKQSPRSQVFRWNSGRRVPVTRKRPKDPSSTSSPASSSLSTSRGSDSADGESFPQLSRTEVLIPKLPHSGSSVDPFDTSCVKVDAEVQRLLLYYLHHAHPNTYYTETHFSHKAKKIFQNDAQAIIKGSFDDEANMYTLLASMASRMRYLERHDDQRDTSPLISRAIAAIQKQIRENAPMSQRMVFNMFHLGTAEFYRWDVAASLVHLKALSVLVQHLGGLKNIHHLLAEMILLGDGYVAAELGEKPIYVPTELDDECEALTPREGIEVMKKLLDGSRRIASGILAPDQREIVPPELRWIVMDMAVCLGVLQDHTSENGWNDAPANILHWLHLRNLAVRHRLMALDLEDKRSQALRTALLVWDLLLFTVAGRVRTAKVVASKLRDCLDSIPVQAWKNHEGVCAWILSIGAMSAGQDSELHSWYVEKTSTALEMVGIVHETEITSFEAFAALESKFLYNDVVQRDSLEKLWNVMALKGTLFERASLNISEAGS